MFCLLEVSSSHTSNMHSLPFYKHLNIGCFQPKKKDTFCTKPGGKKAIFEHTADFTFTFFFFLCPLLLCPQVIHSMDEKFPRHCCYCRICVCRCHCFSWIRLTRLGAAGDLFTGAGVFQREPDVVHMLLCLRRQRYLCIKTLSSTSNFFIFACFRTWKCCTNSQDAVTAPPTVQQWKHG